MSNGSDDSSSQPHTSDVPPPPFRATHLIYALALMASAMGALGPSGVVPGVVVLLFWTCIFGPGVQARGCLYVCLIVAASILLLMLLFPTVSTPREVMRRLQCKWNLRQIMLAMHNYHDVYETFPPAYVADEGGQPMHSWRVLILPYLDEQGLYDEYDFDESWDGPHNRLLIEQVPRSYQCPTTADGAYTSYVAVVDPHTSWPDQQSASIQNIPDGTSNTIAVLEWNTNDIVWSEPRDVSLEEAIESFVAADRRTAGPHRHEDYFYEYHSGRNVAFADGSVRYLSQGIDPALASVLLTIDDGGPDSEWDAGWGVGPPSADHFRRLKVMNVIRVAVFLLLAVLPLPWVWMGRRTTEMA